MQHLLNRNLIRYNMNLFTQEEVFENIASLAVEYGSATNKNAVINGLKHREKEGTTGFFDGFAIPHTQVNEIIRPGIIILVNQSGIEWNSLDGNPAKFFISLLIPEKQRGTTHLEVLAAISRLLVQEEIRAALLNAKDDGEIYSIIKNNLEL